MNAKNKIQATSYMKSNSLNVTDIKVFNRQSKGDSTNLFTVEIRRKNDDWVGQNVGSISASEYLSTGFPERQVTKHTISKAHKVWNQERQN